MIPIIINHSSEVFVAQAGSIRDEIRKLGVESEIILNTKCFDTDYEKCVFLDKDMNLGLRLEMEGVRLFNTASTIEILSDKSRTQLLLQDSIRMPETLIYPLTYFPDEGFFSEFADDAISSLGLPLVAKLAFGSQGREVFLLENKESIVEFQRKYYNINHIYQRFISQSRGRDMRVYMVGGDIVASYYRINNNDFRSNIALGGTAEPAKPDRKTAEMCYKAYDSLYFDFAGIDVMFENGLPVLCEINSNGLFSQAEKVCHVNVAEKIAEYVVNCRDDTSDYFEGVDLTSF